MPIKKLFIEICITMSILYVLTGDRFLPYPYKSSSQEVRIELNEFLVSLLPSEPANDFERRDRQYKIYRRAKYMFSL